jgi:hypothetical protein
VAWALIAKTLRIRLAPAGENVAAVTPAVQTQAAAGATLERRREIGEAAPQAPRSTRRERRADRALQH